MGKTGSYVVQATAPFQIIKTPSNSYVWALPALLSEDTTSAAYKANCKLRLPARITNQLLIQVTGQELFVYLAIFKVRPNAAFL